MIDKLQAIADRPNRRVNTRLRSIFDEAFALIAPFFDPNNTWDGHAIEHLAFRAMRENYPKLSQNEVYVIVMAAKHLHGDEHSGHRR